MDNFSVIITTTGLSCHHKDLHIYGRQDVAESRGGMVDSNKMQFVGTFSTFQLVDSETFSEYNRCIFKPVVYGFSPYVFVTLKRIPETETLKICEVEFT